MSSASLTGDPIGGFSNEDKYLASFWMWTHPLFPVVHKPSFDLQTASPVLRSTMLALGAHMLHDSTDANNARLIHESVQKVLKKRAANGWDTYRVCDLQGYVLHEVFAIFRSRRPPLQLSKNFDDVYRCLVRDFAVVNQDSTDPVQTHNGFGTHAEDNTLMIEKACKQRLLIACYTIDQQHAMLFGRQRTECMNGYMTGLSLPFVQPQSYWDASQNIPHEIWTPKDTEAVPQHGQVYEALASVSMMTTQSKSAYDALRSTLLLSSLTDPDNDLQACGIAMDDTTDPSFMLLAVEQSPRMRLTYYTLMLCRHTPIRDLLAVAGESWVLGEKLASQAQYVGAQLSARDWARGSVDMECPVQSAVHNALRILEIHLKHPKTGSLYQEWSVYLATIVIWARAYVTDSEPKRGSHSVDRPSAWELEQSVIATIAAGSNTSIERDAAKNVLLWTKSKIEQNVPHNSGLMNTALDVLGKLVTKGDDEGWFT
ncbi:hypothetical protein LTR56_005689 [Elasticomyces elasticus]|nr:hypothetical protein LTR56_005689 [Elasticomyces elasticus]KAK3663924.1 hypothetical protein LTR22_005144 [Elasticomyces elasticus]KAK4927430.1 hypothetical protein LTR49_005835 [Elasticomyces elasticus]KAK5743747.1 hypothetical protein LTS12_023739 [Elasticomyces elasticus]